MLPPIDGKFRVVHSLRSIALILLGQFVVGCGGPAAKVTPSAQLTGLEIAPLASTIALGQTVQFKATGIFNDGSLQDETQSAVWASSNSSIASIDSAGLATSLSVGKTTMTASVGAINGSTSLDVTTTAIVSIALDPSASSIPLGSTLQLKATGTYTDRSTHDVTNSVTWKSSEPSVAIVSSSGLAGSKSIGKASITATSGAVSGSCELTIQAATLASISVVASRSTIPLGATAQLTAQGIYTDGSVRDLTKSVSWTSASNLVVSVSSTGVADAKGLGTTVVTATTGGISGSASLEVSPPALNSISISPANPTIPLTASLQLTAMGSFTDGSTQDLTDSATWKTSNAGIVSVNSTGAITALLVGSTTVEAAFTGITGSTAVTVQPIAAIGYFDVGPNSSDTTLRITYPDGTNPSLCAMLYVFDQNQEMAACCGCQISRDGLRTLSVRKDLIGNPLTGSPPDTGSVMLVAASFASTSSCNAASIVPTGRAIAWATHLPTLAANSSVLSEESLSLTPLSATELSAVQAQCRSIQELGGGQGVCSCGTGD